MYSLSNVSYSIVFEQVHVLQTVSNMIRLILVHLVGDGEVDLPEVDLPRKSIQYATALAECDNDLGFCLGV